MKETSCLFVKFVLYTRIAILGRIAILLSNEGGSPLELPRGLFAFPSFAAAKDTARPGAYRRLSLRSEVLFATDYSTEKAKMQWLW